jgi:ribosomal-protein-alanine N-acetyltransferase
MMIPTIATARLRLRPFASSDAPALHAILGQNDVLRYFPPSDPPDLARVERLVQSMLDHWQERGYGLWAVECQRTGEFMGRCGLQYLPDTGEIEVDYLLGRDFWGKGYATEAARASLSWGMDNLDLKRVVGVVHVDNVASQRVLEKAGMVRLERRQFFGIDCYYYATGPETQPADEIRSPARGSS